MEVKIGDRVGAIRNADNETVYLYGFGVYMGEEIPPDFLPIPNPKIQLDDGNVVWGYQCWWGPEEKIREMIGDRKVVFVKNDD